MNYLALKIAIAQLAMHGSYANITLKFLMEPRGGCSKYFQLESFKSISVCRKKKAVEDRLLGNNYQHVGLVWQRVLINPGKIGPHGNFLGRRNPPPSTGRIPPAGEITLLPFGSCLNSLSVGTCMLYIHWCIAIEKQ